MNSGNVLDKCSTESSSVVRKDLDTKSRRELKNNFQHRSGAVVLCFSPKGQLRLITVHPDMDILCCVKSCLHKNFNGCCMHGPMDEHLTTLFVVTNHVNCIFNLMYPQGSTICYKDKLLYQNFN